MLILGSALYLRHVAEQARINVLKQLASVQLALSMSKGESEKALTEHVGQAIERIKAINHGAYLPFMQEPAVQTILWLFGIWGGGTLLPYLALLG